MTAIADKCKPLIPNTGVVTLTSDERKMTMTETKCPSGTEKQDSTESKEAHRLLDAAGVDPRGTLADRIVSVAREWFKHHSLGCQDKISPRMLAILREANEIEFLSKG